MNTPDARMAAREKSAFRGPAVNVLVVDDDPAVTGLLRTVLELDGRRCEVSNDPVQTVDQFRPGKFDLIVLDMMMPGMDGAEVLRRIRRVDVDVPVIIYTGYPSVESAMDVIKLSVDDYLQKPVNIEKFRASVKDVLRKHGLDGTPEEFLHRQIGAHLRKRRLQRGMTLKQLADRTGLSVSLISMIERAESSASIASLAKIAHALEYPLSDLFYGL
ncbi:MAG: Regulator of RpoS [Myxococcota bacterium]|nr:Regulator of RpoS [Myxococcota bacterium]